MDKSEVPRYLEKSVRKNAIREEELLLCLINAVEKQTEQQQRTNELLEEMVDGGPLRGADTDNVMYFPSGTEIHFPKEVRADRRLMKEGE